MSPHHFSRAARPRFINFSPEKSISINSKNKNRLKAKGARGKACRSQSSQGRKKEVPLGRLVINVNFTWQAGGDLF
jgi:hypothetical protein